MWHVDKYKIAFKLVINHWTNEIFYHIVVSSGLSRPGIINARGPVAGRGPAVEKHWFNRCIFNWEINYNPVQIPPLGMVN